MDILLLTSIALFIVGFSGFFIKSLQINEKVRYYFVASILMFSLSLAIGWESAVTAFNEGYEAGRQDCCEENVTAVDSVETDELDMSTE
ncbi:hypothetical protein [Rhodohalobacter barkolensis]|uniref:hypothetical protein n=1 Tax=Rhodohalobacter barkolensis TaxID=2053187 RepID=UPI0010557EDD|nr:hypothetical protein [Rhodohalobacter barkolensis]